MKQQWRQSRINATLRHYLPLDVGQDGAAFQAVQRLDLALGGITFLLPVKGLGCRDPKRPRETLETNKHAAYRVYAPAAYVSDQYFQALRAELQEALVEGIVMVERQEAMLL